MSKILFIADFPLSNNMAGPLLRYFELARVLSAKHEVTLAGESVDPDFVPPAAVKVLDIPAFKSLNLILKIKLPNPTFLKALKEFDAIITHGRILSALGLSNIKTSLIIDLYGPWFIEDLVSGKSGRHSANMAHIRKLLQRGDFFLCASEKQKDLILGLLLMAGRSDPELAEKIGVVPIGLPKTPPHHSRKTLKGIFPGINSDDKLVIWWGGIWDWLDPQTPIKALEIICRKRSDIKLVFFGVKSAESGKGVSPTAQAARKLAQDLDLYNKQVFFMEEWIPYSERADWLMEGDLGIISHEKNLETRFSWRTRALDYLWADLPIISTEGDPLTELIEQHRLGRSVPNQDPRAMAEAVLELLADPVENNLIKQNIKSFTPSLYWENLAGPLDQIIEKNDKSK